MNKIASLHGAETRRLKKIIHKTRDKDLCRRATAVLLVLKGKAKAEVARLLQAGRSSVNRWITWYEAAGIDGFTNQRTGRPPTCSTIPGRRSWLAAGVSELGTVI
ncbi:helix-turn-helix domain-containing protein [Rheinheimera pacifica]|uniref:helix-turn-helix domain-containing protein n=1 Tax=Rheinheimera pacifica TaxID=173990 RepID=UPI001C43427E|nr:helix-turn-helix domain-containing protein [Rheinheimera pacifica]